MGTDRDWYRPLEQEFSFAYRQHKCYLGNKMTGRPFFNFPWFDLTEKRLLSLPVISEVFNPAQHDREMGFDPMKCPMGSVEESKAAGFDLVAALSADWDWIAYHSDFLIVGPDWRTSKGTVSEIACHQALLKPVWEIETFIELWNDKLLYERVLPPIMEVNAGHYSVFGGNPWNPWEKY
jgi:hypothetical protein